MKHEVTEKRPSYVKLNEGVEEDDAPKLKPVDVAPLL